MRFVRRGPLTVRGYAFLPGLPLAVAGLVLAPAWDWSQSRFAGSLLVQITLPSNLFAVTRGLQVLGAVALVVGLGLLVYGVWGARTPGRGRVRVYPLTLLLASFLVLFGGTYLFDVATDGARYPGGVVLLVMLDYAGILSRPVQSTFGALVLLFGVFLLAAGAVGPPAPREAPVRRPAAAAAPGTAGQAP